MRELKEMLVDLALNHHSIGIGKVMVPAIMQILTKTLQKLGTQNPYIQWQKYCQLFNFDIHTQTGTLVAYLIAHRHSRTHKNTTHTWSCGLA